MKRVTLGILLFATHLLLAAPLSDLEIKKELQRAIQSDVPERVKIFVDHVSTTQPLSPNGHLMGLTPHPPFGVVHFEWVNEAESNKTYGTATVRAFAPVAVTRRALKHNEAISAEGVSYEERELTPYLSAGYFLKGEFNQSLRARGFLRAGTLLNSTNTEMPFSISQGETAELVTDRHGLRVSAQVRALANGREGDWIQVENPSSHKVLQAKVTGPGELSAH